MEKSSYTFIQERGKVVFNYDYFKERKRVILLKAIEKCRRIITTEKTVDKYTRTHIEEIRWIGYKLNTNDTVDIILKYRDKAMTESYLPVEEGVIYDEEVYEIILNRMRQLIDLVV